MFMEKERRDLRTKSDSPCLLMGLDGVTYHAQLADISLGGAFIKLSGDISEKFHVGEMCGLMMSDSFNMSSDKYTGKIVRHDCCGIGVSFQSQEFRHQNNK
jgi:hypothetical protein